jgi:hypothetical protein
MQYPNLVLARPAAGQLTIRPSRRRFAARLNSGVRGLMRLWQRRIFGILAIGGGGTGLAVSLQLLVSRTNPIEWLFCSAFAALYAWGIWCGVRLLEQRPAAERANTIYWLLQIPYLASPIAGYFFTSGFHFTVAYTPSAQNVTANAQLGSSMIYSLFQAGTPFAFGVNFFALAACAFLAYICRGAPPNNSSKPTPLRGAA